MFVVTSKNKMKGAASLVLDDAVLSQVAARYNNANYFSIYFDGMRFTLLKESSPKPRLDCVSH